MGMEGNMKQSLKVCLFFSYEFLQNSFKSNVLLFQMSPVPFSQPEGQPGT